MRRPSGVITVARHPHPARLRPETERGLNNDGGGINRFAWGSCVTAALAQMDDRSVAAELAHSSDSAARADDDDDDAQELARRQDAEFGAQENAGKAQESVDTSRVDIGGSGAGGRSGGKPTATRATSSAAGGAAKRAQQFSYRMIVDQFVYFAQKIGVWMHYIEMDWPPEFERLMSWLKFPALGCAALVPGGGECVRARPLIHEVCVCCIHTGGNSSCPRRGTGCIGVC